MNKYDIDNVCTGDSRSDEVNSRIMELADNFATELALKDWGENRAGFYVPSDDGEGESMSEEAQGIWDEYFTTKVDELYSLVNECFVIDAPTEDEKIRAALGEIIDMD